jgi:hypothetical protein
MFALSFALLALANAELDLSDRNELDTDATINVHVDVDQVFYRKASTTTMETVVFAINDLDVQLSAKDNIDSYTASTTNYAKPYDFISDVCVSTKWSNNTGVATLPAVLTVVDDDSGSLYVYQYIEYADTVMYSDFDRPKFIFQASAFVQGTPSASCTPGASDMVMAQNFSNQLCYTENDVCNVWIGDDSDGWVYWGGGATKDTGKFGVHFNPSWNWTGTRREFEINETNLLDIRAMDSDSDFYSMAALSRTHSAPFEFDQCTIKEDGAFVFHIDENGYLERYLSCNSFTFEAYSSFVFDFDDTFDETKYADVKLGTENRWNLTFYPVRVKYGSSYEIQIDPDQYTEPFIELNRLPDGYYLDGAQWLTTLELNDDTPDLVKTWFTIAKSDVALTTPPSTARAPTPAVVVPSCPMNCNGKGRCLTGNTCMCNAGFTVDAVLGCKAGETTAPTQAGATKAPVIATASVVPPSTKAVVKTAEPTRTADPKLFTGTFTGQKAPTPARVTQPGQVVGTTNSAAAVVVSSVVALVALALAL